MAKTMPGVESSDAKDDRHWTANVKIPLGLGGLKMTINMEKVEEREPDFAKLAVKGQGVGAMMNMETSFTLSDADGGGGTSMAWSAEVKVLGPVGSMGQRVLQPIVNQQVQHVLTALDGQVQEATASAQPSPEAAATGTSAAEEGIHPASPETYEQKPEGPTHSTGGTA